MLPSRFIENSLQKTPPALQDIILELRNIIVAVAPGVTETGHSRGFNYFFKESGGPVSAGICQIIIRPDHVRLAFMHGGFLPDPKSLLEGDTLYKRFVRLYSYETAPWDDLKDLIRASSFFDPRTLEFR